MPQSEQPQTSQNSNEATTNFPCASDWYQAIDDVNPDGNLDGEAVLLDALQGVPNDDQLSAQTLSNRIAIVIKSRNSSAHYAGTNDEMKVWREHILPQISALLDNNSRRHMATESKDWITRTAQSLVLMTPFFGLRRTTPAFLLLTAAAIALEVQRRGGQSMNTSPGNPNHIHPATTSHQLVLAGLLVSLFTLSELRMFIQRIDATSNIANSLPPDCIDTPLLAGLLVDAMEKRGSVTQEFWSALEYERPGRRSDIINARAFWENQMPR
jgi:hypothetical protein